MFRVNKGYASAIIIAAAACVTIYIAGYTMAKVQHDRDMLECVKELTKDPRSSYIYKYALSLEEENALLNKKIKKLKGLRN